MKAMKISHTVPLENPASAHLISSAGVGFFTSALAAAGLAASGLAAAASAGLAASALGSSALTAAAAAGLAASAAFGASAFGASALAAAAGLAASGAFTPSGALAASAGLAGSTLAASGLAAGGALGGGGAGTSISEAQSTTPTRPTAAAGMGSRMRATTTPTKMEKYCQAKGSSPCGVGMAQIAKAASMGSSPFQSLLTVTSGGVEGKGLGQWR